VLHRDARLSETAVSSSFLQERKMAYSNKVIDHYENPRKLQIKVGADGTIEDARFKTYGCGSAIASSSLVTEWVKGKTLDEAAGIKNTQIAEELALPPVKIHCSILAEDAIKAAIADYRKRHGDGLAAAPEAATEKKVAIG
jgi:nitrogen fixation NifU-like protein